MKLLFFTSNFTQGYSLTKNLRRKMKVLLLFLIHVYIVKWMWRSDEKCRNHHLKHLLLMFWRENDLIFANPIFISEQQEQMNQIGISTRFAIPPHPFDNVNMYVTRKSCGLCLF